MKLDNSISTTGYVLMGSTAVAIIAAGSFAVSRVISILSPDSKAPASEQAKQPLLQQYGDRHQDAAQMLQDAGNGRPSPPTTR